MPDVKRLVVVLGAGASYDLVPSSGGRKLGDSNDTYRPRLTKHLFFEDVLTKQVLDRYPGAGTLASSLTLELLNGRPLEPLLKELSEITVGPISKQFPEIPLYLQELFGLISQHFTERPFNYARLADALFRPQAGMDGVCFITLNYDLLLEKVLNRYYLQIQTLSSYVTERCLLIKMHGSVDWMRKIGIEDSRVTSRVKAGFDHREYLSLVSELGGDVLKRILGSDIFIMGHSNRWNHDDQTVYYPALSVPLGEYHPVCLADHVRQAKRFLRGCRNVLAIGVSGRDADLFELLSDSLPEQVGNFRVVDEGDGEGVAERFRSGVPQLPSPHVIHNTGFSQFILTGALDEFISFCR